MAKSILGIDIGYAELKIALVKGGAVQQTIRVDMPDRMLLNGQIVSPEAMGELIGDALEENHIREKRAAILLNEEVAYVKNISMPLMSEEQLRYNLPYEFRDYISEEKGHYAFDYMMNRITDSSKEKSESEGSSREPETMELTAVAIPLHIMDRFRLVMKKAGLKLVGAAPQMSAFVNLIRRQNWDSKEESCFVDLGYYSTRILFFKGDSCEVTRTLEMGMKDVDARLAEEYNTDVHLAHTYLCTNFEDCRNTDACRRVFDDIAVEIMRVIRFYRFSNPGSELNDTWLCGGGSLIPELCSAITGQAEQKVHRAIELLPPGVDEKESGQMMQAVGIAME